MSSLRMFIRWNNLPSILKSTTANTTRARTRASAPRGLKGRMSSSSTNCSTAAPAEEAPSSTTTTSPSTSNPKPPLALPELPYDFPSASSSPTQLDMSKGDTSVKLDHLGPMVVNADGTLSRIANWDTMAEIEKENTLRIIGARNRKRLAVLKAREGEKGVEG